MNACPVCKHGSIQLFLELKQMPVLIGVLSPSAEEARACSKGDLRLAFCHRCGFIWNEAFDPNLLQYSVRYDNSLDFSPTFQDYARNLARRLVETYHIRNMEVVELGCGKGHFLTLLCEEGNNRGIGFDPSYEGARIQSPIAERITYYQDLYGDKYTGHGGDLICCRHVLEHIHDPMSFLSTVRKTIGDRKSAIVYFEVPNARFILEAYSIWDIIYEHCNYFTRESLAYLFRQSGFKVLRLDDAYAGQFLSIEAQLNGYTSSDASDLSHLTAVIESFSREVESRSVAWRDRLLEMQSRSQRTVVWGGGAKAVSFLNMLKAGDVIRYVVDINPHKQGSHIPGTGQKIIPPALLKEYQPENIILMNPIYRREIELDLNQLGVKAEVIDA